MVTRPALALLATLLVLGCHRPAPKQVYLNVGDWGPITVEKGTIINVDLASLSSAGYQWVLDKPLAKLVEVAPTSWPVNEETDPRIRSMPGRAEKVRFAYRAQKIGKETLKLRYYRTWEKKLPSDNTWEAEITIK